MAQMLVYMSEIANCSNEIKKEFEFEVIHSKNWEGLVNETIDTYVYQLSEGLEKVKGQEKNNLIKIVQALIYYKENKDAEIEEFQRKV